MCCMAICKRCGTEFDEIKTECPTCSKELPKSRIFRELADDMESFSAKQRWQFWWEIASLLLFSSAVVAVVVNLLVSRRFSWSAYPLITCAGLWVLTTLISFYHSYPSMLFFGGCIDILLLLLGIDGVNGTLTWLLPLGLPIVLGFFAVFGILLALRRLFKRKGLNIPAVVLLLSGIYCIAVEIFVDIYLSQKVLLGWSALAFVSVLPVVVILLFLHFKLRRYMDLRRHLARTKTPPPYSTQ